MQVAQAHAGHQFTQSGELLAAVKAIVAVPLVDDVVMFGIKPAADPGVTPKLIHHDVVIPTPITIPGATFVTPDVAALAVEQRLARFGVTWSEVPFGSGERITADLIELVVPLIARQIGVPGIDVCCHVIVIAGGVVLDKTSRIELFAQTID